MTGMNASRPAHISLAEVDRLVHWMPIVVAAPGLSEWERKFCASVIRQERRRSRRGSWQPSAKQVAVMQRIVEAFQRETLVEDDADPKIGGSSGGRGER